MTNYLDMWCIGLFPSDWIIKKLLIANKVDRYDIVEYDETTTLVAISSDKIEIRLDKEGRIERVY